MDIQTKWQIRQDKVEQGHSGELHLYTHDGQPALSWVFGDEREETIIVTESKVTYLVEDRSEFKIDGWFDQIEELDVTAQPLGQKLHKVLAAFAS